MDVTQSSTWVPVTDLVGNRMAHIHTHNDSDAKLVLCLPIHLAVMMAYEDRTS